MRASGQELPVGCVCAFLAEARTLHPAPRAGVTVRQGQRLVRLCGMGQGGASRAAAALAGEGVAGLVSWGTAGALAAGLAPGTLLLPAAVLDGSGGRIAADERWRQRLAAAAGLEPGAGVLLSSAIPITTPAEKQRLHAACGAMAADMESWAIASAAREAGIPFACVRVIADSAATAIPEAALAGVDRYGRLRAAPMARALLRRPGQLVGLARLGRDYARALARLRALAAACPCSLHVAEPG